MNEKADVILLRSCMDDAEGWGRAQGREVHQRLIDAVEKKPAVVVYKVSTKDVKRVDISFASETVVELARRYRGAKGVCLVDLLDADQIENWEAAALKKEQPIMIWASDKARVLGPQPSAGNKEAFEFAMGRENFRAAEFAEAKGMLIANASMKFKQLWEQGFILRRESTAESGGIEFHYSRIG